MKPIIFVASGGALGALIRAIISHYVILPTQLHIAAINILGSFILTFLYMNSSNKITSEFKLFVGVGILGGFTTMSTFSLDIGGWIINEQWEKVWIYSIVTVAGSLLASYFGYLIAARKKGNN